MGFETLSQRYTKEYMREEKKKRLSDHTHDAKKKRKKKEQTMKIRSLNLLDDETKK